jgi:hypothetical protein
LLSASAPVRTAWAVSPSLTANHGWAGAPGPLQPSQVALALAVNPFITGTVVHADVGQRLV